MKYFFLLWILWMWPSALLGQTTPSVAGSFDTSRYTVLIMEKPAGIQTAAIAAEGVWQYFYEYNDRGRGPRLTTRITLGKNGIPTRMETTGLDYLKNPVQERFSFSDGKARWQNRGEAGERKLSGSAFYISRESVPEESALLARALLAAPGGRLALLPEGEARIERVGELKLEGKGPSRTVVQYAIAGLGFFPSFVWLDTEQKFFAVASGWFTVISEGWESSVSALLKAQEAAETGRTTALARSLAHKSSTPLVIKDANVFDAETGRLRPHTTVVVSGHRIARVGPDRETPIPPGAEVIDAKGKTLLPGLWDMHVHLSRNSGLLYLAAGITTVRDLANDSDQLLETRRKFDEGTVIGPRILMAGFMDGRGPYTGPTKVFVDTEEEAQAAVEKYARLGYVQIKIYSSIKPELVPRITELAHRQGLRVSGHVPAFMTAEQFVKAGADELQHTNFLFLNFMFDTVKDTRTPLRFTAVAEHAAEVDLNSDRVKAFLRLLKERNIVVDPTLAVFENMFTSRPGHIPEGYAPIADRFPPQVRRGFLSGGLPVPEGKQARYRDSFRAFLKMVSALYQADIPIVAGTDALPGFSLHRELELYVEAGIPAPEVLRIATLKAAQIMKRDKELGSITSGKLADLILVDGDPTAHIRDIRRVVMVVKNGVVYQTPALYQAIGIRP